MMLTKFDDFVSQVGAGNWLQQPIYGQLSVGTTAMGSNSTGFTWQHLALTKNLPNPLPTSITAYIVTNWSLGSSGQYLLAKMTSFGSFDISGTTFTDGNAMPTVTECGVSRVTCSPIIAEVTTAISFTSTCNLNVTYTNQDGTGSQTTGAISLSTSMVVGSAGYWALATGDTGCRDITAVSRGGSPGTPTGVIQFWGLTPLSLISIPANAGLGENLLSGAFSPVRLGAGDKLGVFGIASQSARALFGSIFVVGDN